MCIYLPIFTHGIDDNFFPLAYSKGLILTQDLYNHNKQLLLIPTLI
jgi:hypothetical protein